MAQLNGVPATVAQIQALGLINYGHFTSMLVNHDGVRGLGLHLDRLVHDCGQLFDYPLDAGTVRELVRQALTGVDLPVVVRVTVYDPNLELGHPGSDAQPSVLITTRPAPGSPPPPLRLRTARYSREMPEVKHVGLFGSLRHRRIAQRDGFDDALFTGPNGRISEAATSNIGIITGGRLVWPDTPCLPGVTARLLNHVRDEDVLTAPITSQELAAAEAVFATNAAVGVRPVSAIDNLTVSTDHPALRILAKQYAEIPPECL